MHKRLALWKRNYISKGGRITLIKSTLASLPLYQMSLVRMLIVVAKRLEKLQRSFLWGGGALERKARLIKWDVVCFEKRQGGLGLRNLTLLNKALLGKWIWKFASNRDCTWKILISSKYGLDGLGWCSKEACGPFEVGFWKEIVKESSWVKENWRFNIGNGTRVRLWLDYWCGNAPLRNSFSILFDLAVNKLEIVADVWDQIVRNGSWKLNLSKDFNDWEVDLVVALLNSLEKERVSSNSDKISWKGPSGYSFSVSDAYKVLNSSATPLFPVKGIWVPCAPTKAAFFVWEAV